MASRAARYRTDRLLPGVAWSHLFAWGICGGILIFLASWLVLFTTGIFLDGLQVALIALLSILVCTVVHGFSSRAGWKRGKDAGRAELESKVEKLSRSIDQNRELSRRRVRALSTAISGRLNNVLMVMLGSIEMAMRRSSDEMLSAELNSIRSGIDDASSICRRLSRISTQSKSAGTLTSDLADQLRTLQISIRAKVGSRARLGLDIDAEELHVGVSSQVLEQLIMIAVKDHIRSMRPSGFLRLHAWHESIHGAMVFPAESVVTLEIESQGESVLAESARLSSVVEGISGATIAIQQQDQSRITRILLPLAEGQEPAMDVSYETGSWRNPVSSDILIVEDEKQIRNLLHRMLGQYGGAVIQACDSDEACALLRKHSHTIGLAIIDVVLPGTSGLKLAEAIRSTFPQIPVLVMTGSASRALTDRLAADSGVSMLRKPFIQGALDDAIERLVPLNTLSVVSP